MTVESDEETDSLNVTVKSNDGSLYVPTPQRKVRERIENTSIIPSNICFMDLKQLNKLIKQVNQIRCMHAFVLSKKSCDFCKDSPRTDDFHHHYYNMNVHVQLYSFVA